MSTGRTPTSLVRARNTSLPATRFSISSHVASTFVMASLVSARKPEGMSMPAFLVTGPAA